MRPHFSWGTITAFPCLDFDGEFEVAIVVRDEATFQNWSALHALERCATVFPHCQSLELAKAELLPELEVDAIEEVPVSHQRHRSWHDSILIDKVWFVVIKCSRMYASVSPVLLTTTAPVPMTQSRPTFTLSPIAVSTTKETRFADIANAGDEVRRQAMSSRSFAFRSAYSSSSSRKGILFLGVAAGTFFVDFSKTFPPSSFGAGDGFATGRCCDAD